MPGASGRVSRSDSGFPRGSDATRGARTARPAGATGVDSRSRSPRDGHHGAARIDNVAVLRVEDDLSAVLGEAVRRLREENLLGEVNERRFILEKKVLLERWIAGYATHVRPRLLIGTYRTADQDPEALERHLETALADELPWAFVGGAAAARLMRVFRGERTVVHVDHAPPDVHKRLRAQRADDGPLVLLRAPGHVAFSGVKPRTVHPLLIYTELLVTGDPRAREAAGELWERYLEHLR